MTSAHRESDSLKETVTDQKRRLAEIASILREKESYAQDLSLLLKDREYVLSEIKKDMEGLRDQLSKREGEQRRTEGLVSALRDELGSVYDSIPLRISTAAQALQKELEVMRKEKRGLLEEKSELERQLNLSRHENLLVRSTLKEIDQERAALKKLLAEYKEFENLAAGKIEEQSA